VRAERGLVTSVETQATRAGVRILEHGGNAVDAAVAVGYALAVTHPSAGNLGGGGFMLVRMRGRPTVAIDFRERAPAKMRPETVGTILRAGAVGPLAVAVPGSVAGLNLAHARFGRLGRAEVMKPAIELARAGQRVSARTALSVGWAWSQLSRDPASQAEFGRGGHPWRSGAVVKRQQLADTLEAIAVHGDAGFYQGPIALALVSAVRSADLLTLEDLGQYRPVERQPLTFTYRGLVVETMPPPSAGGLALAMILQALQKLEAQRLPALGPEELHLFLEVSRRAQAERRFGVLDLDDLSLAERDRRTERWLNPNTLLGLGPPIDPARATPSAALGEYYQAATRELEHTTHYAVVDAEGNLVACTTTLSGGFGARLTAPGTGVVLNNSLAGFATQGENLAKGGRRPTSSMAPTLVLRRGQPILVLGTPGGDTIPSTIAQVLRHLVDHGMTLDQAIDAPRVHQCFVPDEFRYEASHPLPARVLERLRGLGHRPSRKHTSMGDANSILLDGQVAWGYADPREGGLALAAWSPQDGP
jgi:gamma-glutamyltranspeptidase/glutathione hydrolase